MYAQAGRNGLVKPRGCGKRNHNPIQYPDRYSQLVRQGSMLSEAIVCDQISRLEAPFPVAYTKYLKNIVRVVRTRNLVSACRPGEHKHHLDQQIYLDPTLPLSPKSA